MNIRRIYTKLIYMLFISIIQIGYSQDNFYKTLSDSTIGIINADIVYDSSYFSIKYPNGDVPKDKGVCTDVVIRAYRKLGIDLQKEVHEDMKANFDKYPKIWGLKSTDKNIDHRRVPNLMVFFSRKGVELPKTESSLDYKPGDVVCWDLGSDITHIGIVVNIKSNINSDRYQVVHNIGNGQELSDCLFDYKIIGHYRYKQ